MTTRSKKRWTDEERKYIQESFANKSFVTMARYLKRSVYAVECQAQKMGLTHSKHETGMITLQVLADTLGVTWRKVKRWEQNHGLPSIKKVTRVKGCFTFVDIDKFWEWASHNQNLFDSRRLERLSLGPEPVWMKEKRRKDFENPPKIAYTEWTKEENERLTILLNKDVSYMEIAKMMGKTYSQVYKKVHRVYENKRNQQTG